MVAVLSNGVVENEAIELPDEHLRRARSPRPRPTCRRTWSAARSSMRRRVPPTGDRELDAVCDAAQRLRWAASHDEPVFVGGAASMAQAFDAVDTVRSVLRTLEQQYVMVSLVRDVLNRGLSVAIGAEHGVEPLAACSVVVRPVVVDGEQVGTVGVLGPTRMDYPQALATVEAVSDRLGRRLSDGGWLNG